MSAHRSHLAITATAAPAATPTTVLFGQETGDTAPISVADIHQGQIGDCFLLAAIGEIALLRPSFISSMISANANGTESVKLFADLSGHLPTGISSRYAAMSQTVANSFAANGVNNGATQDLVGGKKEIWVQVLEKAYAQAGGGYGSISNGGSPVLAMEALTGHAASFQSPASLSLAELVRDVAANDLIVMDTKSASSSVLGSNLVGNHAYMFEGLTTVGGVTAVKLGNPWGDHQPDPIPFAQLSRGIVEVDIGHLA